MEPDKINLRFPNKCREKKILAMPSVKVFRVSAKYRSKKINCTSAA